MNDFPGIVNSQFRFCADDALDYAPRMQPQQLQADLNTLGNGAKTLHMCLNTMNCFHHSFGETSTCGKASLAFSLCGQKLEHVSSNPYLSEKLQSDLKRNMHISQIEAKAKQKVGMIKRMFQDADLKTQMVACTSLVMPGLEHGCVVWDPYFTKDISVFEKKKHEIWY